ncbi:endo-1,4-beta-xylanase C precursor [Gymnopus androsaceus JB14]|uniref:Beta-xylanase n=1 Tax=Gymnopus androsaceus JB14 TaxID=1447944 RepID=A0A6A4GZF6_9AGAR|nr:endo-1,4-beta-xylanase C precursor [Gymnopus androsaceus JB14]
MLTFSTCFVSLLAFVLISAAQAPIYGQCGGIGFTGPTTCAVGSVCVKNNDYFSNCDPLSTATTPVNAAAQAAGKLYFGTATDSSEFTNGDRYYPIFLTEFGQITPENSMNWNATEPEQGVFTFAGGDAVVALAQKYLQLIRGYSCVWYNQIPEWLANGTFTVAELTEIIQTHCGTLVGHYEGQICIFQAFQVLFHSLTFFDTDSWDVINEPFNDDGTWRSDVFYNTLDTSFVPIALEAASTADPNAKLYINDYNIEFAGPKATAMMELIQTLKASGVPIHGVGLQCHFVLGQVPDDLQTIMEQFAALGVEVAVTELDIRMTLPATNELLIQQKADYQSVISACNAVPDCVGVTIWDYTDKYSWIPSAFPGQGEACPWDLNYNQKPAYDGIIAGFA